MSHREGVVVTDSQGADHHATAGSGGGITWRSPVGLAWIGRCTEAVEVAVRCDDGQVVTIDLPYTLHGLTWWAFRRLRSTTNVPVRFAPVTLNGQMQLPWIPREAVRRPL